MELEAAAAEAGGRDRGGEPLSPVGLSPSEPGDSAFPFPWTKSAHGLRIMDPLPLLSALGRARQDGTGAGALALAFHQAVIRTTGEMAVESCREEGLETVALGGGVFQNAILLGGLSSVLQEAGLRVLIPRALSPNDGAISFGQAAVAAALLNGSHTTPHSPPEGGS